MTKISRRDFLKRAGAGVISTMAVSRGWIPSQVDPNKPNVILILFDAMSASNLSLHGYPRETSLELSDFANRSTVYHNHQSAGNFTSSGTASMLTGMLPWGHRALQYGGLMTADAAARNPFRLFGDGYTRLAFCQNPWADRLVGQHMDNVDLFLPLTSYSVRGNSLVPERLGHDRSLAELAFDEFLFSLQDDSMGSSVLGYVYKSMVLNSVVSRETDPRYPRGMPEIAGYTSYANQDVFRGVLAQLLKLHSTGEPFFTYFHLYSPHAPYKPDRRHLRLFEDNFTVQSKPVHPFHTERGYSEGDLLEKRLRYDQQIAQVDTEFGNLMDSLESNGILDNSYVIVTSDHGEMFERGYYGHGERMLYEPAIRIPLLIRSPGQAARRDVFSATSNIDLLPTLYTIMSKEVPPDIDGRVLPGFGSEEDYGRTLLSMEASENSAFQSLTKVVIALRKENYKLIGYMGYFEGQERYELYDLSADPDELNDLALQDTAKLSELKQELHDNLSDANRRFASRN